MKFSTSFITFSLMAFVIASPMPKKKAATSSSSSMTATATAAAASSTATTTPSRSLLERPETLRLKPTLSSPTST